MPRRPSISYPHHVAGRCGKTNPVANSPLSSAKLSPQVPLVLILPSFVYIKHCRSPTTHRSMPTLTSTTPQLHLESTKLTNPANSTFPHRNTFATAHLCRRMLLSVEEPPPATPRFTQAPQQVRLNLLDFLAPQTSPPATNAAGISRSTLSSPSDHGQGPNCKAFKTSRVLSAKRSFSFYSFCSELQKFLEKCRKNRKIPN